MKKIVLDTNFIFSFFDYDDNNNEKALRIFAGLDDKTEFIVPEVVVAELLIKESKFDFLMITKHFSRTYYRNNDKDLDFISNLDQRIKKPLKAVDCLILALCKRHNVRLLTFDKKLEKSYRKLFD